MEETLDKNHQEGFAYDFRESSTSCLPAEIVISNDCAITSGGTIGQQDVQGACISDIPEYHPLERQERLNEEQAETCSSLERTAEGSKEGQDKCVEDIEMSDILVRSKECFGKEEVERYEETEEGCFPGREEVKLIEKSVAVITNLITTGPENPNMGESRGGVLSTEDVNTQKDSISNNVISNYPGTEETINTFYVQKPNSTFEEEEDVDECVQKTVLPSSENERIVQSAESKYLSSIDSKECQNIHEREADKNSCVSFSEQDSFHNVNIQNYSLMDIQTSQPNVPENIHNPPGLESLNYECSFEAEPSSCDNGKPAEEQTTEAFVRNHEESLCNVDAVDGNHCLTDTQGNVVEDGFTMDSSVCSMTDGKAVDGSHDMTDRHRQIIKGCSVGCSLMVENDVYDRIQGLLVQCQFNVDDLMKYFFTLHEWYMMSSSSSTSLPGISDPTYCTPSSFPCGDKVTAHTSMQQGSKQDQDQIISEIGRQEEIITPKETSLSTSPKNRTESDKAREQKSLLNSKGCYEKQHELLHRNDKGVYKCIICKFGTRSSLAYLTHINHHGSEKNKCRICGKICGSKFSEHVHKKFHHKRSSSHGRFKHLQKCEVCGDTLLDKSRHAKLCKGNVYVDRKRRDVFKCIKCGMCFGTLSRVHQHIMYRHASKWQYICPCGFRSQVLSPFLTHKRICKQSNCNVFRNNILKASVIPHTTQVLGEYQSDQSLEQTLKVEDIFATGLHVLADVSEHRLSDARGIMPLRNASKDNVIDLSVQNDVPMESTNSSVYPSNQTTFNLPPYQSSIQQLPLVSQKANQPFEQRHSTYETVHTLNRCNTLPGNNIQDSCVQTSEMIPGSHVLQKLASSTTYAIDLTNTDSQNRRPSVEVSEYKKERIRRNSGQGLERAISALRCKALSEMNRRKTADDICILKDDPEMSTRRPKERYSLDSSVSHKVTANNPYDNQCTSENPFGTAVIDLSKVNVNSISQFDKDKAKSAPDNMTRELSLENSHVERTVFGGIKDSKTKRRNSSTVDEAIQQSLVTIDSSDLSAIRVTAAVCHCPGCAIEFSSSSDLFQHIRTSCRPYYEVLLSEAKGKMECKICNIDFFSHKQALIHHIRSVHGILLFGNVPSRKALICKICNQTFMNEAYLREHINGKHFGTRYSCTCGKTFKWRSSFSGHKRKCNGVITSTVNSRGRGKPLSIPRKRFDADCTDSTYRMTWKQQKTQHSPRTEQSSDERSKGMNSVPGIETLLANVRKERMMETLPSAPIANTNIQSIGTPQSQQIQSKRTVSNSVRDPNSLRISPKVKSFMEPIVQKATKDNLSRTTDTARQANSNISLSAPERNMGNEKQMTTVHFNRKTDNITVTNPTRISVKQEKDQMNTLPSGLSNIKTEKNESQESGQVSSNRDTQSSDKLAMQNAYPVSPYMLYPNLFNFHPQNFLQEELQGSKSNTQKAPLLTKENDFSNVPQTNPFENHLMSVNSLVPFFANALNTLQQSIIPNAANPSLQAKSPRTEKTRPATSSSVSSTFSASMNKTAQAGADFGCNSCKKRFASRRELENHPCKLYCEICKINFKCKASAREHMLGKHGGENRYSCPCGLRFKWRSSLGCHQRNCPKAPPKKIKILQ